MFWIALSVISAVTYSAIIWLLLKVVRLNSAIERMAGCACCRPGEGER